MKKSHNIPKKVIKVIKYFIFVFQKKILIHIIIQYDKISPAALLWINFNYNFNFRLIRLFNFKYISSKMPGTCHYNAEWEIAYPWLSRVKTNSRNAYCSVCLKEIRIDNSGLGQVKTHARSHESATKRSAVANWQKQRQFSIIGDGGLELTAKEKQTILLTDVDKIKKAELLQALHMVEKNISFASAKNDNERFRLMFPDSKIASSYEQGDTKVVYVIKYALADHIKEGLIKEVAKTPFSFLFDETTTSQVKKQYDAYLIYWSEKTHLIEHAYIGSLFVGHCDADDLVKHYQEFVRQYGLENDYLLHVGMDGPNVNLSFEKKLAKLLEEGSDSTFLKIGSCSLHPVHGAFQKGIKELYVGVLPLTQKEKEELAKDNNLVIKAKTFDIDDFFCDLHFFFKLSSARREDYASLVELTGVVAEYAKKHAETRWVSMQKVAIRCLEQWKNLEEYFLRFLPKQKNFNKEIKNTQRYNRIKIALSDKLMPAYVGFVVFSAQDFQSFLVPFQSKVPLIHQLYPAMMSLVYGLMRKFIKTSKLNTDDLSKNITIDVRKERNLKPLKSIEVGCKAKLLFSTNIITDPEQEAFRKRCLSFYQTAVEKLQMKLPLDINLLKDAQYINPMKRNDPGATSAISNLALKMTSVLGNVLQRLFGLETRDEVIDKIRSQWALFQNEEIKDEWYLKPTLPSTSGKQQESYWARAREECGIDAQPAQPAWTKYRRIDEFWGKVEELVDNFGAKKYPQLVTLVKCVVSLSHGNATPERGFSINKILLDVHGYSTYEDTIVALRMVKDALNRVGGCCKFPITRGLLQKAKDARSRYDADREARRALKDAEQKKQKQQEEEEKHQLENKKKVDEIDEKIESCRSNLSVANDLILKAQETIAKSVNEKNQKAARALTQQGLSELQVGNERKRKFDEELEGLLKKKGKLSK